MHFGFLDARIPVLIYEFWRNGSDDAGEQWRPAGREVKIGCLAVSRGESNFSASSRRSGTDRPTLKDERP